MSKMNFSDVWRVLLIYVLMLVVGIAIVAKIIVIQTVDREELLESARKADIRIVKVPAVRGNIFSMNPHMSPPYNERTLAHYDWFPVSTTTASKHILIEVQLHSKYTDKTS